MKIALIGASGLLGCALAERLRETDNELLLLSHGDIDICDKEGYQVIDDFAADVVINTAAFLGVEPCEASPEKAFLVNTLAVNHLARFCQARNMVFAQVSTDAVFDGCSGGYDEEAVPNPLNMYGLTKLGGEFMARNLCDRHYVFRVPILFGHRKNKGFIFIEKMMEIYNNGRKNIVIADDIINRPSYSVDVANKIIDTIIENAEYGIYHIFNGGDSASLYDFAAEYFTAMNVSDISLSKGKAHDFAGNEVGKKALNTTLNSVKLTPLRNWRVAMRDYCRKGF